MRPFLATALVTTAASLALASPVGAMPAPDPGAKATAPTATAAARATVSVRNSRFGRILTDGRGYTLYLFTRETTKRSRCYGGCAVAWPPLLTTAFPRAAGAARAKYLGTTRRSDGTRQVTYRGHPVYYYVNEKRPLQVLCQNVFHYGGLWLVVSPSGKAIR